MHDKARSFIKEGQEAPRNQQDFYDFNYGYDVFVHSAEVMAEAEAEMGRKEDEVVHGSVNAHTDEVDRDKDYNLATSWGSDADRVESGALAADADEQVRGGGDPRVLVS